MVANPLTRAWLFLIGLSAVSTLVAALVTQDVAPAFAGAAILSLAWLKARVILSRYLGLWQAPAWNAGFNWVLGFYALILLGLYLIPALTR